MRQEPLRDGWHAFQHESGRWQVQFVMLGKVTWFLWCTQTEWATPIQCENHAKKVASELNKVYGFVME